MDLLRQEDEPFDYVGKYGTQTGLFSLKIHYNGQFGIKNQNLCYITGKVIYVDFMDTDMFCIHDVNDAMRLLGFSEDKVHHFYFVVPGSEIHSGLMSLSTDDDSMV
uniref:PB1-like domain-containing protein n=1 Tax=Helianthus annuus TaxID=4232 RepID=A0A251VMB5_HELAN